MTWTQPCPLPCLLPCHVRSCLLLSCAVGVVLIRKNGVITQKMRLQLEDVNSQWTVLGRTQMGRC